jgi:hypothetical protein
MPYEVGAHPLGLGLVCAQAGLLLLTIPVYNRVGLSVEWLGALPLAVVVAGLATAWAYYRFTRGRPPEWALAETILAFALLTSLGITIPPAQYAAAALGRPLVDSWLAAADASIGINVGELASWTAAHPAVNTVLRAAYFTLLWQFLLIVPGLGALRDRTALWEYVFHFHFCSLITLAVFAWWPAASAFQYFGFASTIDQSRFIAHFQGVRDGTLTILRFGQMEGLVSMPSFHVAGALMVTWALRRRWWLLVPVSIVNIGLIAATFMSGAHYVVDLGGTLAMCAASLWAWRMYAQPLLQPRMANSRRIVVVAESTGT